MGYPITAWCCLSTPPESIRKPKGFLIFSGGVDKQHRAVMGETRISTLSRRGYLSHRN